MDAVLICAFRVVKLMRASECFAFSVSVYMTPDSFVVLLFFSYEREREGEPGVGINQSRLTERGAAGRVFL